MVKITRITQDSRIKLQMLSTVLAIVMAVLSPILVPLMVGEYNSQTIDSTTTKIFTLNSQGLHNLTCCDPGLTGWANEYENYTGPSQWMRWNQYVYNSSLLTEYYGGTNPIVIPDFPGRTPEVHDFLAVLPPAYPIDCINGSVIWQTTPWDYPAELPGFSWNPSCILYDGSWWEDTSQNYRFRAGHDYVGINLARSWIAQKDMLEARVNITQRYQPCSPENMFDKSPITKLRLGLLEDAHKTPVLSDLTSLKYEPSAASDAVSCTFSLSELARTVPDGDFLALQIDHLEYSYYPNPGTTSLREYSTVLTFEIWSTTGPYTINYIQATDAGLGISGLIMIASGNVIIWNMPASREYVSQRRLVKLRARSERDVQQIANNQYLANLKGGQQNV